MSDFIRVDEYRVLPFPNHFIEDRDHYEKVVHEGVVYDHDEILDEGHSIGIVVYAHGSANAMFVEASECRFMRTKSVCIPIIPIYHN